MVRREQFVKRGRRFSLSPGGRGPGCIAIELRANALEKPGFRNPNLNPNPNLPCFAEIRIKIKSGRTALIQWQWGWGEGIPKRGG